MYGSVDGTNYSLIGSYTAPYLGYASDQTVQDIALTGADNVRYLRMSITSTWTGGWHDISSYTLMGLGEVAFGGVAIPDPPFISPIGATTSGNVNELGGMGANNLIGEASSAAYVQVSGSSAMWEGDTYNTTATPPVVRLTFDLGGKYDVSHMYVWGFNWPGDYTVQQRSLANFDLYGSSDGSTFSLIGNFTANYLGDTSDQLLTILIVDCAICSILRMSVTRLGQAVGHEIASVIR